MIKHLLAMILLAFGVTNAMAADLPVKAAPPIVAAEYNWTGIYGGVNAGWIRDNYDWAYTNPAPAGCCRPFSASQDTWLLGGQVGIQYQYNHFVFGVELAAFTQADNNASFTGCIAPNSFTTACQIKRDSVITAGGRLGYAWNDWLFFGSGGGAWSNIDSNLANPPGAPFDFTGSQYRSGWYAGVGVEYVAFKGGFADIIVGAEYQHIDLGSQFHVSTQFDGPNSCPLGVNCRTISDTSDLVRARLSVKINPFQAPAAAVVARY